MPHVIRRTIVQSIVWAIIVLSVAWLVGQATADRNPESPATQSSVNVAMVIASHHHWRACRGEDDHPKMHGRKAPGGGCYWNARTQGNGQGASFYVTSFGLEGTRDLMVCWFYPSRPSWNVCEK